MLFYVRLSAVDHFLKKKGQKVLMFPRNIHARRVGGVGVASGLRINLRLQLR